MSKFEAVSSSTPILLVGCGKMGSAMLGGWLKKGLGEDAVYIVDPYLDHIKENFPNIPKKQLHKEILTLSKEIHPSIIIAAVKPQMMDDALDALNSLDISKSVILSIAAGKTISYFEDNISRECAVIRAMPNIPASIGKGITVCVANDPVTEIQKKMCTFLLETIGVVEWIEDENLIDAVTALSGSGPAYVFYLVEAMAAVGETIGLSNELSRKLARQTVSGAGALLDASEDSASKLRENVTSPGGTTAAALDVLMSDDGMVKLIRRAMLEAKRRSKELAN